MDPLSEPPSKAPAELGPESDRLIPVVDHLPVVDLLPVVDNPPAPASWPRYSLAKAIEGDAAFDWGDAVAIVQQLVEQLIPDGPVQSFVAIPPVDAVEIDAAGALHARFDPNTSRSLVVALGDLLRQLSAGIGRPPGLRLFAMRAISAAPPLTLSDFCRELAEWAPPNGRERLIALYQRAFQRERAPILSSVPKTQRLRLPRIGALAAVAIVVIIGTLWLSKGFVAERTQAAARTEAVDAPREAIARPTEPAAATSDVVAVKQAPPPTVAVQLGPEPRPKPQDIVLAPEGRSKPVQSSQRPARGSASESSIGRPVPAVTGARGPEQRLPPTPARQAAPGVVAPENLATAQPRTRPIPASPGRQAAKAPPVVTKAVEQEFERARVLFERRAYASASEGFSRVLDMIPATENGGPDLRFVAGEYLALSRASLAALQTRVYTREDASVTEPVAMGQFLPPAPDPGIPQSHLAVLELLIDARGNVESARLAGESAQFRTQWWVSASKSWRFRPAMKDDNPVRFLKRIVVADSKPLEPR